MQNTIRNLAILVATKDRHDQLKKLLNSICESTFLPNKVVIVYSGGDVTAITDSFLKKLNLEILYSEISSQMYQKSIGIKNLGNTHQWVFFLDDDVLLEVDTVEIIYSEYLTHRKFEKYVGFGLSISNRSTRKINSPALKFLECFSLYSDTPGIITKSGHAQSYLDSPVNIEVQWLNGISVWDSKVLSQYPETQSNYTYSAYEDVNFSYKVSKNDKLLFAAKAKVINQKIEGHTPLTINQFKYGGYLRYKFVSANTEFSQWWLLVAQFIRGLDFIFRSNKSSKIINRIKASSCLWLNLFSLVLKKQKKS